VCETDALFTDAAGRLRRRLHASPSPLRCRHAILRRSPPPPAFVLRSSASAHRRFQASTDAARRSGAVLRGEPAVLPCKRYGAQRLRQPRQRRSRHMR
jgi:hypothetical protein